MKSTLRRTAQLGLLARDMVALRASSPGSSKRVARRRAVADRLGALNGIPRKIGQLLAFSELDESHPAFLRLTEGTPALAPAKALAEMARQLAALGVVPPVARRGGVVSPEDALAHVFRTVDAHGIGASLSQVHRAVLRDGREVAVKLQYPEISEAVRCDLRALGILTAPVGDLRRGFDMEAYRAEIGGMLAAELDFTIEAARLRQFGRWAAAWPDVTIPSVVPELSGDRLLTMSWLSGVPLSAARNWPALERFDLGSTILRFFLTSCFEWGLIHADPHPGNYRFIREVGTPKVGILDFGCVKELGDPIRRALHGLILKVQDGSLTSAAAWDLHVEMGFSPVLLHPLRDRLMEVCGILFEPFAANGRFDVGAWDLRPRISALLGAERMNYRLAGPPGILFLLRAFQGMVQYLKILGEPLDWNESLRGLQVAHAPSGPPARPISHEARDSLHIRVTEDSETRVNLTFDAEAANRLADLVPPSLKSRIASLGIDLARLPSIALDERGRTRELLLLDDGPTRVRIWITSDQLN